MKLETFVGELALAVPSEARLRGAGLDDEDIESIRRSFTCVPGAVDAPNQTLRSLVTCWDCGSVQVGGMSFARQLESHPRGVVVACHEGDPVIEQPDGQIVCENHDDPGNYSFVGASAGVVLDCLLLTARFNGGRAPERRTEVMKGIAQTIGGPTEGFWEQVVSRPLPAKSQGCR